MGKMRATKLALVLLATLLVQCNQSAGTGNSTDYDGMDISNKSQVGLLRLRGFRAEVHYAITRDGYHLNLIRIVNPHIPHGTKLKRPVLFNHGLIESSTIWLIGSRNVQARAKDNHCWSLPIDMERAKNDPEFQNAPMMLAINGYDVWLLSMRGTDWSLYHEIMDRSLPEFWDYSLDQFALDDVPTAIEYVRRNTGSQKVGYVGHSQATFSIFGLFSESPTYADVVEPVFAVAPVAYFSNITSSTRTLFTSIADSKHLGFGPFPESAKTLRQTLTQACAGSEGNNKLCDILPPLIGGLGSRFPKGFLSHLPYFTSIKVMRHFGQLIKSRKFSMYDHGPEGNKARYGQTEAPLYDAARIKSRSLVLFWTKTDTIAHPKDVERFISELKVPLLRNIFIDRDFNHFDLVTAAEASYLVNKHILEVLEEFEQRDGACSTDELMTKFDHQGQFGTNMIPDSIVPKPKRRRRRKKTSARPSLAPIDTNLASSMRQLDLWKTKVFVGPQFTAYTVPSST